LPSSVSKRARQNFDLERFDPRKLDDVEIGTASGGNLE
jgi:hypothetical protein